METILTVHSVLRYAVLLFLLLAIFNSLTKWMAKKPFLPGDRKLSLFTLIFTHLQAVLGFILYFQSDLVRFDNMKATMGERVLRFFTVEHILLMLIAVVLITVGNSKSKRASTDVAKHKGVAVFFIIALVLILISIPWPFMQVGEGRGWF